MTIEANAADRLPAADILDLADHWLLTDAVVALEINDSAQRETIGSGLRRSRSLPTRPGTPHRRREGTVETQSTPEPAQYPVRLTSIPKRRLERRPRTPATSPRS